MYHQHQLDLIKSAGNYQNSKTGTETTAETAVQKKTRMTGR